MQAHARAGSHRSRSQDECRNPLPHNHRPAGPPFNHGFNPTIPPTIRIGIAAAIVDGLILGSGDAVIGINPAGDNVASTAKLLRLIDSVRQRYAIPTQSCVLSHITTQLAALEQGAPVDLIFQSIAGTEQANASFGVNLALLNEANQAASEHSPRHRRE